MTLGIRQLFRYYEMGIRFRTGSRVTKTTKTTKNFPLSIENVRAMFQVGDLKERVILSMASDLGLRLGNSLNLSMTATLDTIDRRQENPVPI
jgi:hypothetical protein